MGDGTYQTVTIYPFKLFVRDLIGTLISASFVTKILM